MTESKLSMEDFERLRIKRAAEDPRYCTISQKLRELFWDDSCNDINLRFYQRLEREAIIHGDPVRKAIRSCASSADSARDPVRYFCASVTRRLREQGYLQQEGEDLGL